VSYDKDHVRGLLALVVTAVLWSTGGLLIKSLPLTPMTIAGTRSAIAAVVMLLWIRRPKPIWTPAQIGSIAAYTATVILFVTATKLTTAANAILLQYTAPIWVALLSVAITRERLTRIDVAAVATVVVGMGVFFLDRVSPGHMLGNVIAVASGVAFALVALCMRAQRGVSTTESILFGNVLSALVCLPFAEPFPLHTDVVVNLLLLGVVQLGISYLLYAWAMAHVSALEAVLVTVLEPLLNPIWVAVMLHEAPSPIAIAGGIIVIGGVLTRNILQARRRPPGYAS